MMNRRVLVLLAALSALIALGCNTSQVDPFQDTDAAPHHAVLGFVPTTNGPDTSWKYVNLEGQKATYWGGSGNITLLSGINLALSGSATKTVKVTRFVVGPCYATAAAIQTVALRFCSPGPDQDGGYFGSTGNVLDPNDSAPTAILAFWFGTAGAHGTCVNEYAEGTLINSAGPTSPAVAANTVEWDFCGGSPERCPTLRGVNQWAIFTVTGGGALTGQKCPEQFYWTEE